MRTIGKAGYKPLPRRFISLIVAFVLIVSSAIFSNAQENNEQELSRHTIIFERDHFPSEYTVALGDADVIFSMNVIVMGTSGDLPDQPAGLPQNPPPVLPDDKDEDDGDYYNEDAGEEDIEDDKENKEEDINDENIDEDDINEENTDDEDTENPGDNTDSDETGEENANNEKESDDSGNEEINEEIIEETDDGDTGLYSSFIDFVQDLIAGVLPKPLVVHAAEITEAKEGLYSDGDTGVIALWWYQDDERRYDKGLTEISSLEFGHPITVSLKFDKVEADAFGEWTLRAYSGAGYTESPFVLNLQEDDETLYGSPLTNKNLEYIGSYIRFSFEGDLEIAGIYTGMDVDAVLLDGVTAVDINDEDASHLIFVYCDGGFGNFVTEALEGMPPANDGTGFAFIGQVIYAVADEHLPEPFLSEPRNLFVTAATAAFFSSDPWRPSTHRPDLSGYLTQDVATSNMLRLAFETPNIVQINIVPPAFGDTMEMTLDTYLDGSWFWFVPDNYWPLFLDPDRPAVEFDPRDNTTWPIQYPNEPNNPGHGPHIPRANPNAPYYQHLMNWTPRPGNAPLVLTVDSAQVAQGHRARIYSLLPTAFPIGENGIFEINHVTLSGGRSIEAQYGITAAQGSTVRILNNTEISFYDGVEDIQYAPGMPYGGSAAIKSDGATIHFYSGVISDNYRGIHSVGACTIYIGQNNQTDGSAARIENNPTVYPNRPYYYYNQKGGGGILLEGNGAEVNVNSTGVVRNNRTRNSGGGIFVGGDDATINIYGLIDGNSTNAPSPITDTGDSGGIHLHGQNNTVNINDGGIVQNNSARRDGGGITLHGPNNTVNVNDGAAIHGNKAVVRGGGIASMNYYAQTNVYGAEFKANRAESFGGAIYVHGETVMVRNNVMTSDQSVFTDNSAGQAMNAGMENGMYYLPYLNWRGMNSLFGVRGVLEGPRSIHLLNNFDIFGQLPPGVLEPIVPPDPPPEVSYNVTLVIVNFDEEVPPDFADRNNPSSFVRRGQAEADLPGSAGWPISHSGTASAVPGDVITVTLTQTSSLFTTAVIRVFYDNDVNPAETIDNISLSANGEVRGLPPLRDSVGEDDVDVRIEVEFIASSTIFNPTPLDWGRHPMYSARREIRLTDAHISDTGNGVGIATRITDIAFTLLNFRRNSQIQLQVAPLSGFGEPSQWFAGLWHIENNNGGHQSLSSSAVVYPHRDTNGNDFSLLHDVTWGDLGFAGQEDNGLMLITEPRNINSGTDEEFRVTLQWVFIGEQPTK